MDEHDLRQRDVQLFEYSVVPTIILLLSISGLINGGLSTAREWESRTIKELPLAPVSRAAIIAGKVFASFAITFCLGTFVLLLGICSWLDAARGHLLVEYPARHCAALSF